MIMPRKLEFYEILARNLASYIVVPRIMDVYLMIQRKKLTMFTDAKDNTNIYEVKKMIEGIIKVPPCDQMLFNKDQQSMEDDKTLAEYGYTAAVCRAQTPGLIGLSLREANGEFESLDLEPYSTPPDLPYVMKNNADCQDGSN